MRPPAHERQTLGSEPTSDVTPGISLKGLGDWRNLTHNESIQIATINDLSCMTEASFHHNGCHSNSIKYVDTIVNPTRDIMTSEEQAHAVPVDRQPEVTNSKRTLVSLDKLATRSGRLLDSRLIFSPCPKGDDVRRTGRPRDDATRVHLDKPRTSQHRRLWHSDSELFVPLDESILVESTSLCRISSNKNNDQRCSDETETELLPFVDPLETITHTSKVGEIKTVPLLSTYSATETEIASEKVATETAPTKPQTTVNKVCSTITRSIKKKRKTITNIGRLHELFRGKDTKYDSTEQDKVTTDVIPSVSKLTSRECLKFEADVQTGMQETNTTAVNQTENKTTENHQTGSEASRRPCLGVRKKESTIVTIDKLEMDLVCDLKRKLTTTCRKVQIKTNGSLKLQSKLSPCAADKMRTCSPKRIGSRRYATYSFRTNRACIISTV